MNDTDTLESSATPNPADVAGCNGCSPPFVEPSDLVTINMLEYATTDDHWHTANNLNAMMRYGYCPKCKLVPQGCEREGCRSKRNNPSL